MTDMARNFVERIKAHRDIPNDIWDKVVAELYALRIKEPHLRDDSILILMVAKRQEIIKRMIEDTWEPDKWPIELNEVIKLPTAMERKLQIKNRLKTNAKTLEDTLNKLEEVEYEDFAALLSLMNAMWRALHLPRKV